MVLYILIDCLYREDLDGMYSRRIFQGKFSGSRKPSVISNSFNSLAKSEIQNHSFVHYQKSSQ